METKIYRSIVVIKCTVITHIKVVVVKGVMKAVVTMVIRIIHVDWDILARETKREMTIEYLKCRADFNFEVDFGVNGAIGAIVTKWDLILFG